MQNVPIWATRPATTSHPQDLQIECLFSSRGLSRLSWFWGGDGCGSTGRPTGTNARTPPTRQGCAGPTPRGALARTRDAAPERDGASQDDEAISARIARNLEYQATVDAVFRAHATDQGYARVKEIEEKTVTPHRCRERAVPLPLFVDRGQVPRQPSLRCQGVSQWSWDIVRSFRGRARICEA
jgi:hypothetical protein